MLAKNWIQTIDRSIAVQEGAIDCKVVKELKELRNQNYQYFAILTEFLHSIFSPKVPPDFLERPCIVNTVFELFEILNRRAIIQLYNLP